ncbi:ImmA/IrrE family metallo-endopeptidase [Zunongwangia endophytica]|uniref:ImmA/IrrE family metallo-endopeptidase n=1 Tax=Zunongwangia endophytica TaxID=1808945 RepID=A0ABV8H502_9FLAO|nr:ImmA/IrrE family metallo-endopeptidase [Zunongwangia endophytica]MDN3595337.1 ImmA/IrrE family metallo-endopeptidase [Zunongwangia endophytica]
MAKINKNLIEKNANDFRNINGISPFSALDLNNLLRKLKVNTLFKPLSNNFSGMAIKSDSLFILINTSQNIGRQNFTICHELYHLFIQEDFNIETTYQVGKFNRKDINEFKADCFASFLLMPEQGVFSLIPNEEIIYSNVTLDTIVNLEQYFKVSRIAMLYRLLGLGLINNKQLSEFSTGVIISAIKRGYSEELYKPNFKNELISDYGDLANKLLESEKISEGDYYSLMRRIGIDVLSNKYLDDDQRSI